MNETICHLPPLSLPKKRTVGLSCSENNFKKTLHSWYFLFLFRRIFLCNYYFCWPWWTVDNASWQSRQCD